MSILACPTRLFAVLLLTLLALAVGGCASAPAGRDARGNPHIERMTPEQLARLEQSNPSPPAQTEAINAQVQREIAEADARAAREARERQRELRARRQDPFYSDPFYSDPFYSPFYLGRPLWPGYWNWQLNYPTRSGVGIFWRSR
jgi:hypothetical protein